MTVKIMELEESKKNDVCKAQSEYERINRDYRIIQEEKRLLTQKL